jgi:hypothetical protein
MISVIAMVIESHLWAQIKIEAEKKLIVEAGARLDLKASDRFTRVSGQSRNPLCIKANQLQSTLAPGFSS